ncbi:hypothetical protein F5051DRAFT_442298 [Lentinula edodes]|nr:hypothetical protein F5051DRAFT_442298 [Lentinula edodes]
MALKMDPGLYFPNDVFTKILHIIRDSPGSHWPRQVLVLASVCRGWRDVAIGTATLWRRIVAPAYGYHFIVLSLDRSQQCPLVIEYHTERPDERVLSLLAEHSERWEDMSFCIPQAYYSFLSSIKGKLPLLKCLALQATGDDIEASSPLSGFEIAPALQSLDLRWFHYDLAQDLSVSWAQLTNLCCQSIKLSTLYSLLANTPMLFRLQVSEITHNSSDNPCKNKISAQLMVLSVIDCDLRVVHSLLNWFSDLVELSILLFSDPGQADIDIPIILPHLHTLKLQINGMFAGLANFLVIKAPCLAEMEFCGCHSLEDSDEEFEDIDRIEDRITTGNVFLRFLRNFIQASGCSLTSLTLYFEVDFHACEMTPILEVLQSLKYLDISVVRLECLPLRAMTPASVMFPNLQNLYLRIPPGDYLLDGLNNLITL